MKFTLLFLVPFVVLSCKNGQRATDKEPLGKTLKTVEVTEGCPEKSGSCSFEVMPGKSYTIKTDKTGMMRPELEKSASTLVVKFTFKKNQDQKQVDGQYREEVYAIIPADQSEFEAVDEQLKEAKFLYGRFCYCQKSSVGYVKVDDGRLKIENGQIRMRFDNGEIPQKIKEVAGKF